MFCCAVCLPCHQRFLSLAHRLHDRSAPSAGGARAAHALAGDRSVGDALVLARGTPWANRAWSGPVGRAGAARLCPTTLRTRASKAIGYTRWCVRRTALIPWLPRIRAQQVTFERSIRMKKNKFWGDYVARFLKVVSERAYGDFLLK